MALPFTVAAVAFVGVWLLDPWSLPAMLLGIVFGAFLGAALPTVELRVPGPVAELRRRQPWTEPRFTS